MDSRGNGPRQKVRDVLGNVKGDAIPNACTYLLGIRRAPGCLRLRVAPGSHAHVDGRTYLLGPLAKVGP